MNNEMVNKLRDKGFIQVTTNLWKAGNLILYIDNNEIEIYENDVDRNHDKYFYGKMEDLNKVLDSI